MLLASTVPVNAGAVDTLLPQWRVAEKRILAFDCHANQHCLSLMKWAWGSPKSISNAVNHYLRYRNDRVDEWDAPESFFASRYGDCEEFVFMKLILLKAQGYDMDKARIVILQDKVSKGFHMSLSYDGEVLDYLDVTVMEYLFYIKVSEDGIWF